MASTLLEIADTGSAVSQKGSKRSARTREIKVLWLLSFKESSQESAPALLETADTGSAVLKKEVSEAHEPAK